MIIGLTGYAQHGKDSVGQLLVEAYGFQRLAFADALKSMALTLNPIIGGTAMAVHLGTDGDDVRLAEWVERDGWEVAKESAEVRRFLQVLGTEAVRDHLGADSWVNAVRLQMQPGVNYVITDVRFPNEADFILEDGVELWRIVRVNEDNTPFDNGVGTDHPSEKNIASLPVTRVLTAANLTELEANVRGVMEHVVREA